MYKDIQITLAATGMKITKELIASHVPEILTKHEIVGVFSAFNKKPSNANLYYSTPTTPFAIGKVVKGVTSNATGTIVRFIGTVGLELSDVVGTFVDGENLIYDEGVTGVGTAAAPGTWNGVTGATSGSGTGITFNVTDVTGVYDTIAIANPGTGYDVGDTVTILGTSLGGATPANDLVITITGDNAVVDGDPEPTFHEEEWSYPYSTMTIVNVTMADQSIYQVELQDVTNQATWNLGTLAALQQAVADIQAWL